MARTLTVHLIDDANQVVAGRRIIAIASDGDRGNEFGTTDVNGQVTLSRSELSFWTSANVSIGVVNAGVELAPNNIGLGQFIRFSANTNEGVVRIDTVRQYWLKVTVQSRADDSPIANATVSARPVLDREVNADREATPLFHDRAAAHRTFTTNASGVAYVKWDTSANVQIFISKVGYTPHAHSAPLKVGVAADLTVKLGVAPAIDGEGERAFVVSVTPHMIRSSDGVIIPGDPFPYGTRGVAWLAATQSATDPVLAGPVTLYQSSSRVLQAVLYGKASTTYFLHVRLADYESPDIGGSGHGFQASSVVTHKEIRALPRHHGTTGLNNVDCAISIAGDGENSRVMREAEWMEAWITTGDIGYVMLGASVRVARNTTDTNIRIPNIPNGTHYLWVNAEGFKPLMSHQIVVSESPTEVAVSMTRYRVGAKRRELFRVDDEAGFMSATQIENKADILGRPTARPAVENMVVLVGARHTTDEPGISVGPIMTTEGGLAYVPISRRNASMYRIGSNRIEKTKDI